MRSKRQRANICPCGDGVAEDPPVVVAMWSDTSDPARLVIRMDNVAPESAAAHGFSPGAYWAMKADMVRHSP